MKLSKHELEAVIAASPRSFVPFNKLVLSPTYQARPANPAAPLALAELAASIEAAGLLHNLIVVRGARGMHEVCAGGRRLRAMALLVEQGRWAENQPVPVLVVPAEQALMASLIENVEREALNPADEFAAFARLIDGGRSVEDVAAAFGVTPQVVKRRLKLAAVSPALLTLFREGGIGLDCLMVLASIDDPARQEQLWQQLPEWNRSADQLRRLLTRGEVESDRDGVAIFVTVAAYEAAGGPLRRDLFSDDGKAYLQDAALLERLALDKLQQPAREVAAEGWKWSTCGLDTSTRTMCGTAKCVAHAALRPPTRQRAMRSSKPSWKRCTRAWRRCQTTTGTTTATRTSTPRWEPTTNGCGPN